MSRTKILVGCYALLLAANHNLLAQDKTTPEPKAKSDQPFINKFLLHAAKPPHAPLKYRLLPKYIEQTSGNAAPQYMRAVLAWEGADGYQVAKSKIRDWNELPLAELKANAEANAFFNSRSAGHWDLIRLAALKEQCDWELPLRQNNIRTHIPELQKMQSLGQLIVLKARMEMARGQLDDAIETLKTAFAHARHVDRGPTLANGMVGYVLAIIALQQVETLVQQPNCPNLYWTLTNLPSPLVDLRSALEMEQDGVYLTFPELRDVRTAKRTAAEWEATLNSFVQNLAKVETGVQQGFGQMANAAYLMTLAYPKAKAQLEEAGYTQAKIDAMPVSQAILTAIVETFDRQRDQVYQFLHLPMPESYARIRAAEKELAEANGTLLRGEIVPLAHVFLTMTRTIKSREVRLQRELAALRTVEALRLYAAEHDNALPQKLSDIESTPVPVDPATGKPFEYELKDGKAVLSASPLQGELASTAPYWQLELAATKSAAGR